MIWFFLGIAVGFAIQAIAIHRARINREYAERLEEMPSVIHGTSDGKPCNDWGSDATFICAECKRTCCYCNGSDDGDLCNDCWFAKEGGDNISA